MIKISYQKQWGNDGTVYTQTIRIDKNIMNNFNKYIRKIRKETKEEIKKNRIMTEEQSKILYYLEELKEGKNYTTLTELIYFINFYLKNIKKDKNFKRIKWHNTIFIIV